MVEYYSYEDRGVDMFNVLNPIGETICVCYEEIYAKQIVDAMNVLNFPNGNFERFIHDPTSSE